ncbi:hypothetical protein [Gallaecimonas pentaromativorans]|uniref:Uncharacterized protein n=1 Tax=Gallaecimonas pentaromativorans TaxID=584787 RepID=A0A3N1P765_9GAMM|nr:hypothetical protein [Gallaecimonas pentaromativorans]MED5526701.1 hypothetical protein [Pseudomonadota bacterium]ROQ22600.1 hypothetical protein EDC28_10986 [Gallaecimonas pentaromativorans]
MKTLAQCQQQCLALARLFRLGMNTEAALEMVPLLEQITAQLTAGGKPQPELLQVLGMMLGCQERQDWLGLADYLEFELQELISAPV